MTADPIPAIREEEAVGDTAEIFADLRATLGLPFVNLIWRHLATVPGALQAVWPAVRPLYLTAELAARSAGIGAGARPGGVEPVPREAWSALGVDEVARRDVAGLVDAYNRANSTNFLVFTTIDVLVRGGRGPGGRARTGNGDTAPVAVPVAAPAAAFPPLPPMDALSPDLQALVLACDELGRLGASAAHASLYRHLALWPPFLATAYVALSPLHRSGALQAAQRDLIEVARSAVVDELVPLLPQARLAVDDDVRARIGPVVEEFATIMIGRMVVAGAVMRALLPDPDDHAAG
ncbi:MAG: hypothetical protein J0I34_00505 [Pseudonocardia sp.]|uniref:hypothetical protein n=1 Tax=unclassified Pseudonocardia TaxID=2619320 RepID=UPI00086B8E68|nr:MULTISPECIES: hypothetical protein [unclassified Pseudonocardia]MBN9107235.1 hypothetical protein [Pseudonocardia sp.]ODU26981.1 MAG: hypothetical protein ABS80_05210 [Pseudonocardia sp. SCN 72-51]ODV05342.1 MAG: hypothetical protein ABT15_17795 [Pseudonocardia sp. SCN 73-27]